VGFRVQRGVDVCADQDEARREVVVIVATGAFLPCFPHGPLPNMSALCAPLAAPLPTLVWQKGARASSMLRERKDRGRDRSHESASHASDRAPTARADGA